MISVSLYIWIFFSVLVVIYIMSICKHRNETNVTTENVAQENENIPVPVEIQMDRMQQIECATVTKIVKRSKTSKQSQILILDQDCEEGTQTDSSESDTSAPSVSVPSKVVTHQESSISLRTCESGNVLICLVCLNDFDEGDEIRASRNGQCRHIFHKECITAWLKNKNDCPICRQDFLSCCSSSIAVIA